MRFADYSKGYILKLEPAEELHETLTAFVLQKRIPSAFFQGIGGVTDVKLGYFDLKKNDYDTHSYKGDYELISASGNISDLDGKPAHTHVVLSDENTILFQATFLKGL